MCTMKVKEEGFGEERKPPRSEGLGEGNELEHLLTQMYEMSLSNPLLGLLVH